MQDKTFSSNAQVPYLEESQRSTLFSDLFAKLAKREDVKAVATAEIQEDGEDSSLIIKYASRVRDGFSSSLTRGRTMISGSQEQMTASINLAKNLPYIALLVVAGCFFMMMALFYLPIIILVPSKFSFAFALASICFLSALAIIREPNTFIKSLLSPEKMRYTAAYGLSLLGTFYFSLVTKSFIFSFVFAIAQVTLNTYTGLNMTNKVVSLMWLIGSSIPGGLTAARTIQNFCLNTCKGCFGRFVGRKRENSFLPI